MRTRREKGFDGREGGREREDRGRQVGVSEGDMRERERRGSPCHGSAEGERAEENVRDCIRAAREERGARKRKKEEKGEEGKERAEAEEGEKWWGRRG